MEYEGSRWNQTLLKLKNLTPNTEYVWQVKAACDNNLKSDYTEPKVHFTTLLRETNIIEQKEDLIEISPNPASSRLTVSLNDIQGSSIIVFDVHRRMIVRPTTFSEGQAIIDISGLVPGFYSLHIINDGVR